MRQLAALTVIAAVLLASTAESSRADLVRLSNGRFYAGRIIEETPAGTRFQTGEPDGPREIAIDSREISQTYRALEEAQQIDQCRIAAQLQQWTAAYYHSDNIVLAKQCLERAWKLDKSIAIEPLKTGTKEYQTFWNRLILKRRAKDIEHPNAQTLADLARWAHDAELKKEAAHHLRGAWIASGKKRDYVVVAKSWEVNLESWIELDLKPALTHGLFQRAIRDEDTIVAAEAGKAFLVLPIWYDRHACPNTLSKSNLEDTARQGYYGIRLLQSRPDASLLPPEGAPIYERVELRSKGDDPAQLVLKNHFGPRTLQGDTADQQRLNMRPEFGPPSNWAAILIELPEDAPKITLDWQDGGSETIDLDYLRAAHAAARDAKQRDPNDPEVTEALNHVESHSGAVAELALTQLEWMRKRIPPEQLDDWSARVDRSVIEAGGRFEDQVRSAAWSYFASGSSVSSAASRFLAGRESPLQTEWIKIISAHNKIPQTANFKVAAQLLCAILESDDEQVCDAALDAMIDLKTEIDWTLIGTVSEAAQLATLDRLHLLPEDQVPPLLLTLMKSVRPASAEKVAQHARFLNLSLTDPHDPILEQWQDLSTPVERIAFFKVIGAADLGDVIYSDSFGAILEEAVRSSHARVRNAAFSAVIDQTRRRAQRCPKGGRRIQSNFPVLVSVDSRDPVINTLTRAASSKSHLMQLDALEVLLIEGYAEQAEKSLLTAAPTQEDWIHILKALSARDVASSSGFLALLGRLLKKPYAANSEFILSYLKQAIDENPNQRKRMLTALKAGVEFPHLSELAIKLDKPHADTAKDFLYRLGHLSSQDRQRLEASRNPERRLKNLERIDLRRAQLVDGQYAVIAIVETTACGTAKTETEMPEAAGNKMRWHIPERITVSLPSLTIRSDLQDEKYRVSWEKKEIGRGVARGDVRKIRGPDSFSPRLVDADSQWRGPDGWGWLVPAGYDASRGLAWGPVVLPSWPALEVVSTNTMTLEISEYLHEGLRKAAVFGDEDLKALVPDAYEITLRYAAFASYYGVGTTRPQPRKIPEPGQHYLLNVMLILEKE